MAFIRFGKFSAHTRNDIFVVNILALRSMAITVRHSIFRESI